LSPSDTAEPRIEDTAFFSGPALRLSARIYHPPGAPDGQLPGVVFCHGFGGTKLGTPVGMSRLLAMAGYRVMTFDYRGFGEAEGPVGRLVPSERVEDAVTALEWFATRDDVDARRIGLYGTSYGGSTVLGAARRSSVPRCVIATVPVSSGSEWLRSLQRPYEFDAMLDRARAALAHKARTGEFDMVDRDDIMIQDPAVLDSPGRRYVGSVGPVPMAIETVIHVMGDEPIDDAPAIRVPVLIVAVRQDHETPVELAMRLYDRLKCPKRLVVFAEGNHVSVYNELLDDTFEETQRWLTEHVSADPGRSIREDGV
jgi:dipeptidyl aminopeptidase/acylaminoacyl peptidase